jgi:fatty acid desaturase
VSRPDRTRPERNGPLLTQRAALVFLLAALAGVGATVLAALSGSPWPVAVSVGCGAAATAVLFFKEIIG